MTRFVVTDFPNGTTDLTFHGVTVLEVTTNPDDGRDTVAVGMPTSAFESLSGAGVRRSQAKALDDARSEIQRLSDERDEAAEQAALWKSLAERQDNTAPLRRDLRIAERERDEFRARYEGAKANAEYVREQYGPPDEVAQLKAAIVRQAREISLLSGESE